MSGVFLLAACSGGLGQLPKLEPPESEEGTTGGALREYRLGPGDRLSVVVFGQPDLSGEFVIDGTGNVTIPLIGQVKANGLIVTELQDAIALPLDEKYVVDPRISIEVINYRPFYVLGEVNSPGRYDYINGLDLRQAIAMAGGFNRRGLQSVVKLIRDVEEGRVEYQADLDSLVLPGDTIEAVRRVF